MTYSISFWSYTITCWSSVFLFWIKVVKFFTIFNSTVVSLSWFQVINKVFWGHESRFFINLIFLNFDTVKTWFFLYIWYIFRTFFDWKQHNLDAVNVIFFSHTENIFKVTSSCREDSSAHLSLKNGVNLATNSSRIDGIVICSVFLKSSTAVTKFSITYVSNLLSWRNSTAYF